MKLVIETSESFYLYCVKKIDIGRRLKLLNRLSIGDFIYYEPFAIPNISSEGFRKWMSIVEDLDNLEDSGNLIRTNYWLEISEKDLVSDNQGNNGYDYIHHNYKYVLEMYYFAIRVTPVTH